MPTPNNPTDDLLKLDHQLCFALYSASLAMTKLYKPLLEELGLTYPQYLVMLVLWEWQGAAPAQPTVKALGERLLLDSGTLTPLLKRLEQLGLLARRRSAADERELHLALTAAGSALRERVAPLKNQLLCERRGDLDELAELREQVGRLLDRFMVRR